MAHLACWLGQRRILTIIFLAWIIYATGCATPTISQSTRAEEKVEEIPPNVHHVLKAVRVIELEVHIDLKRSGAQDIYYSAFKAIDPLRLILDLSDTVVDAVPSPLVVENEIIGRIETITLFHESEPHTRIEISLNRDAAYLIDQGQEEIWVKFYTDPQLIEAAAALGEPVVYPEVEQHPPANEEAEQAPAAQPLPDGGSTVVLRPVKTESLSPANKIMEIQVETSGDSLEINIIGNGKLDNYRVFLLRNPPRLVLDLMGVKSSEAKEALSLSGSRVRRIRLGRHADRMRVVFDLASNSKSEGGYHIIEEQNRLVVSFQPDSESPS